MTSSSARSGLTMPVRVSAVKTPDLGLRWPAKLVRFLARTVHRADHARQRPHYRALTVQFGFGEVVECGARIGVVQGNFKETSGVRLAAELSIPKTEKVG